MTWRTVLDMAALVLMVASAALLWRCWAQGRRLDAKIGQLDGLREYIRAELEQVVEAGANGLYAAQEPLFGTILLRLDAASRPTAERLAAGVAAERTPVAGSAPLEPVPPPAHVAPVAAPPSSTAPPSSGPQLVMPPTPGGRVPTMRLQPAHLQPLATLPFEGAPSTARNGVAPPPLVQPPAWVASK